MLWPPSQTAPMAPGSSYSAGGTLPRKRMPKPSADDRPHAALLRRRSLAMSAPLARRWGNQGAFAYAHCDGPATYPLWQVMNGL